MQKITYSDKTYLQENADVAANNKISDSDMNMIKSVVNNNVDEYDTDMYYSSGDTIQIGGTSNNEFYIAPGYISGSSKDIVFSVNTPKRLNRNFSVSVTSLQVALRGINGYVDSLSGFNQYVNAVGYSTTATVASGGNAITIVLTKTDGFSNVTNNTPISVAGLFSFSLTL